MAAITLDRKAKKMAMKKLRLPLLDRQTELNNMNCNRCTAGTCISCPISDELRDIGRKLLELSNEAYEPPEELTWTTYNMLKEREWGNKRICRHYGIERAGLYDFIRLNKNPNLYQGEEIEMVAQYTEEGVKLTVERYLELKKAKKSDSKIRKEFGLQVHDFNKFKKKHGLIKKKEEVDGKLDTIGEIPFSPLDVSEREELKVNPLDSVVEELKAKIHGLQETNEKLEDEKLKLSNDCNEYYQKYTVAKSGLRSYADKTNTMKSEHAEEIQRMNSLLEKAHHNDAFLTQILEQLVQARKTITELSN